jgi:DMSO/TMAO reductase YedYZ heme-binding membrane subunit
MALAVAISVVGARAIKHRPLVVYAAAVAVVALYLIFARPTTTTLVRPFLDLLQKGQLGFAFFVVVMFIGVLKNGSVLKERLGPVRGELSVLGSILMCGHAIPLLINYSNLLGHFFQLRMSLMVPLLLSLILLIALTVLTATSFKTIKPLMDARFWRRVQRLAYPFFGLIYLHILGYLIVPALQGAANARLSIVVYSVIFVSYVALRVRAACREGATRQESGQPCPSDYNF